MSKFYGVTKACTKFLLQLSKTILFLVNQINQQKTAALVSKFL